MMIKNAAISFIQYSVLQKIDLIGGGFFLTNLSFPLLNNATMLEGEGNTIQMFYSVIE